jgi:acyl carrier protein
VVTRDEVVTATRSFIRDELGTGVEVTPRDRLVQGGIVTSLDLVALMDFVGRRFSVPVTAAARDHFQSLDSIAELVIGAGGTTASLAPLRGGRGIFGSFARAPLVVAASLFLGLVTIDRAFGWALENTRLRALLVPQGGVTRFATRGGTSDSFERAFSHHELARAEKLPGETRVVFLGDSATAGSGLEADEAVPAVASRLLAPDGVRVFNLSYITECFPKDAALLELALPHEPDIVVVTVGIDALDRETQDEIARTATPLVHNRDLFRRFLHEAPVAYDTSVLDDTAWREGIVLADGLESRSALLTWKPELRSALLSLVPRWSPPLHAFAGKTDCPHDRNLAIDGRALAVLEAMIGRARGMGAKVLLFRRPEPTIDGHRYGFCEASFRLYDETWRALLARTHVASVDALDTLGPDDFTDGPHHWTKEGSARLGRLVADGLGALVARPARAR